MASEEASSQTPTHPEPPLCDEVEAAIRAHMLLDDKEGSDGDLIAQRMRDDRVNPERQSIDPSIYTLPSLRLSREISSSALL